MVKYTHLNRDPGKAMEDLVKKLNASAKGQKTKPSGVKDLGESGDLVWPRPDGTPVSVRDVDLELEDARSRIGEAEESLAESQVRIGDTEQATEAVRGRLSDTERDLDALDARVTDVDRASAARVSRGPLPPTGAPLGAQWRTPEGYLYVRVDCDEEAA